MAVAIPSARSPRILWSVLEEHFEEAAYGLVCFARALESPFRTLVDLARYPEQRTIAQVDALLLGGTPVRERVLVPALNPEDKEDDEPERLSLAAWTLMDAGDFAPLIPVLREAHSPRQSALVIAAHHVRNPSFDALLTRELARAQETDAYGATLLSLAAARQLSAPNLLSALQSDDSALQTSAALCARHGDSAQLLGVMQYLVEQGPSDTRDAALVVSLAWGSPQAWSMAKRWAFDPAQESSLATLLVAALGTRADHEQLALLLNDPKHKRALLFALGFSGNTALYPVLAASLDAEDPIDAKLAAQSLGLIFGFAPDADEFALPPPASVERSTLPPEEEDPEAAESLPPLEEDDLDADLVPSPEHDLPLPNVAAIKRHCEERTNALGTKGRVLYGQPFSAAQVARVLQVAPLRVRHGLALAFGVRTGGALWVQTRAATAVQRAQIGRIPSLPLQRHSSF